MDTEKEYIKYNIEEQMDKRNGCRIIWNKSVFAHKLCGAGNGGFFLTFSKKEKLDIPFNSVKINVETKGVTGKELWILLMNMSQLFNLHIWKLSSSSFRKHFIHIVE